jgi:hypothetical protein
MTCKFNYLSNVPFLMSLRTTTSNVIALFALFSLKCSSCDSDLLLAHTLRNVQVCFTVEMHGQNEVKFYDLL